MATVQLEVPEEVLAGTGMSPAEFGKEFRLAAAIKWYESGQVSQSRAALIAGLSRSQFLKELGRFKVSAWQYTRDEIEVELNRVG
jgi:predicted HTH domain antitoxin